jgi:hypothetical protein
MLTRESPAPRNQSRLRRAIWLPTLIVFAWAWAVFASAAHASDLRAGIVSLSGGALLALAWWRRRHRTTPFVGLGFASLTAACAALIIRPSNERAWAPDSTELPWADVQGDIVTLHNYRNFDWQSATEATPRWETRTLPLSALRHVDFIMTYWGSPHICHTMVSFDFGPQGRVCASIEARRTAGEEYSPLAGAFRRYELLYVFGEERDVLRVRTNFRAGNEVHLYRLTTTPEAARIVFLDYLRSANALRTRPEWYHSIATNCTTLIRQHARPLRVNLPWDWRLLANGHADKYLYDLGYITRELPFEELKRRSLVTPAARLAPPENFSDEIRRGRPGF